MVQLRNFGLFLMLFICAIPALCLAEPAAVTDPAAVKVLVLKQGFPVEIAEALAKLAAKRDEVMKPGMRGELIFKVAPLEIKDTNDALRIITARPELLPRRTFEELTGVKNVSPENLPKVLDALFDPTDLPQWFRGEKGEELSAEAIKEEATIVVAQRNNSIMKSLQKMEKDRGKRGVEEFLEMFNHYKDRVVYPNREVYRSIFRKLILVSNTNVSALLKGLKLTKAEYLGNILILTEGEKLPTGGIMVTLGNEYPGNPAYQIEKDSSHFNKRLLNDRQLAGHPGADEKRRVALSDVVVGVDELFMMGASSMENLFRSEQYKEESKQYKEESKQYKEESKQYKEETLIIKTSDELTDRICASFEVYRKSENKAEKKKLEKQILDNRKQFDEIYVRAKSFNNADLDILLNKQKMAIDIYFKRVPFQK